MRKICDHFQSKDVTMYSNNKPAQNGGSSSQ